MKKRSLSLRREPLSELSFDELGVVAGGAQTVQGPTCPLIGCLTAVTGIITDECYTNPRCTTD